MLYCFVDELRKTRTLQNKFKRDAHINILEFRAAKPTLYSGHNSLEFCSMGCGEPDSSVRNDMPAATLWRGQGNQEVFDYPNLHANVFMPP